MENKFINNKKIFLDDIDFSENTKNRYYSVLTNDVIAITETNKDKDLYDFTSEEISTIISTMATTKSRTQIQAMSVINRYINHAIERGWLTSGINPCDALRRDDIKRNRQSAKSTYIPLDEFYSFIKKLDCSNVDKALLTLLRYGVTMKEVLTVEFSNVDTVKKVLLIEDEKDNTIKELPIDDRFIEVVELSKRCEEYGNTQYIEGSNFIVKPTKKSKTLNENSLRTRLNTIATNNNILRPSINNLNKSAKFDMLLRIERENNSLTTSDICYVLNVYDGNYNANKMHNLLVAFEEVFQDKEIKRLSGLKNLNR